jgi:hypothetical protein
MRYRDLLIVERRRSEKGVPRVHKDRASSDDLDQFRENAVKDLERMALDSGIDMRDLYISYTGLDKIGINPVSGYNTPIGVYCYPLEYALKRMKASNDPSDVPYMGKQPYIWLFTPKNPERGLELATYTEEQLLEDMEKIRSFLSKQGLTEEFIDQKIQEAWSSAKQTSGSTIYASMFWNATRVLGKDFGSFKNASKISGPSNIKLGDFVELPEYTGWSDTVGMVVTKTETTADVKIYSGSGNFNSYPLQGLPLNDLKKTSVPVDYVPAEKSKPSFNIEAMPKIGDTVEVVKGPFEGFEGEVVNKVGQTFELSISIFGKATKVKDLPPEYLKVLKSPAAEPKKEPDASDDNIVDFDVIDDLEFEPEPDPYFTFPKESIIREESNLNTRAKTSIIEWNRLMRVAGYDFIVDRNDSGLIHPSEETQAVFLSGAYFTPIGKIRNTARNIRVRPPYTTDQINSGKYDPITFERWLKVHYKNYDQIHGLYSDTVKIQSEKLINKLVVDNDLWLSIIDGASSKYGYLVVKAKANRLAKLVNSGEDEYDINRAIRDLESAYTGDPKDIQVSDEAFLKNPKHIMEYIEQIKKGPWPAAESAIADDSWRAYRYASRILRKPWPAGEEAISKDPETAYNYAANVLHEAFPKGEPQIQLSPDNAADYAINVLQRPWPEAEDVMALKSSAIRRYRKKFPLYDDLSKFKPGDMYAEVMSGLQKLVMIANTPENNKRIQIHDMHRGGELDETAPEFIAPIKPNRYGFKLGEKYKVNKNGDTGMLVGIEESYEYIFLINNKTLKVKASEVFEFNSSTYKKPSNFSLGDIVEFSTDWWGDGTSLEKFTGYITSFPKPGVAIVSYGVYGDHSEVEVQDLKHYVGKYKQ